MTLQSMGRTLPRQVAQLEMDLRLLGDVPVSQPTRYDVEGRITELRSQICRLRLEVDASWE